MWLFEKTKDCWYNWWILLQEKNIGDFHPFGHPPRCWSSKYDYTNLVMVFIANLGWCRHISYLLAHHMSDTKMRYIKIGQFNRVQWLSKCLNKIYQCKYLKKYPSSCQTCRKIAFHWLSIRNANVVCISCTKPRSIFPIPISPSSHRSVLRCYVSVLLKHMDDWSCTIKQILMSIFGSCLPNRANVVENSYCFTRSTQWVDISVFWVHAIHDDWRFRNNVKKDPIEKFSNCGNDIL